MFIKTLTKSQIFLLNVLAVLLYIVLDVMASFSSGKMRHFSFYFHASAYLEELLDNIPIPQNLFELLLPLLLGSAFFLFLVYSFFSLIKLWILGPSFYDIQANAEVIELHISHIPLYFNKGKKLLIKSDQLIDIKFDRRLHYRYLLLTFRLENEEKETRFNISRIPKSKVKSIVKSIKQKSTEQNRANVFLGKIETKTPKPPLVINKTEGEGNDNSKSA